MTKCIIIEDNPTDRDDLLELLGKVDEPVKVLSVCSNIDDGYKAITEQKPELVFLDIDLDQKQCGFDLLMMFDKLEFAVIFTTRYKDSDTILRAFRACALYYLPKMVLLDELNFGINRFVENRNNIIEQVSEFKKNLELKFIGHKKICIPNKGSQVFIEIDNIMYCESKNTYTHFYIEKPIENSVHHTSSKSIKEWEDIFTDSSICRIHNEYLVNMKFITKIKTKGDGMIVKLKNGNELSVSKGRKNNFKEQFKLLNKSNSTSNQ